VRRHDDRPSESRWSGLWRRLAGLGILALAIMMAWSTAPERSVTSLVARWAPPPSDFAPWHDQLVHWRDQGPRGDPTPIVLLHGTADSLHTWEGWVKVLARERRVITLDLPGFGLTGPWTGRDAGRPYTGDSDARFMLDFLAQQGVHRMILGGNSLGGEVAWRAALLAPDRVTGLVLVAAAGLPLDLSEAAGGGAAPMGSGGPLPNWMSGLLDSAPMRFLSEHALPRRFVQWATEATWGEPTRTPATLVDRHFELLQREGNRAALTQRLAQWRSGDATDQLPRVRVPTLLLWGGRDRVLPPIHGRTMRDLLPDAQLVVFEALGHVLQEEDPQATVTPVQAFASALSRMAPPPSP